MRDRPARPLPRSLEARHHPERLPAILTDALIAGYATLAVIGLVEYLANRRLGSLLQPVAAVLLIAWAVTMQRRGNPRPILLLFVTVTVAFAYLVAAVVDPTAADVTDTSPIAIVVGAGVIALAAGGRNSVAVGLYALVLATLATVVVQVELGSDPLELTVDALNSLVVMTVAFAMVRAMRRAVDDSVERYRRLVDSAPVAVVELDLGAWKAGTPTFRLGPMNPTAAAVLGYHDGPVEVDIARSDISEEFVGLVARMATAPTGTDIVTIRDGRTFKVGWRVDAITGWATLSGTDITAQRRSEEQLSDQISARDRFIATVSHELRTPLTGAMGMLEVVRGGGVDDSEREEMIDLALHQVRDMADIVDDLLVAARAAGGRLTVNAVAMDLSQSVDDVMSATTASFESRIEPGVTVWADPVRVRQIVRNLVTNAVRYGGPSRQVFVRIQGREAIVEVVDDGPPLAAEFVARMFEPYERSGGRSASESVGLGLTVARTLARLMGGDVTYHHDGMAVFRLTLPLVREGQPAPS